jgi:hypothetical protein
VAWNPLQLTEQSNQRLGFGLKRALQGKLVRAFWTTNDEAVD